MPDALLCGGTIELGGFIMKVIMEEEACCPCDTKKRSVMKVTSWGRDLLQLLTITYILHEGVLL